MTQASSPGGGDIKRPPEVINDVACIGQLAENVLRDGPLFEVAVIHHTQCRAGALADDTFRHCYAERIGANESALREHPVLDPAATVARDVEHLRSAPAISPRLTVSGHVYDVVTGWCRRSCGSQLRRPTAEKTDPLKETKHHDNRRYSRHQARPPREPRVANSCSGPR